MVKLLSINHSTARWFGGCLLALLTVPLVLHATPPDVPDVPPVQSAYTYRITNRRFISHVVYEWRGGRHLVTLLTTHGPAYNAFHAVNHSLHHACQSYRDCLSTMQKLNSVLTSGANIGLKLKGSEIVKIIYYEKSAE